MFQSRKYFFVIILATFALVTTASCLQKGAMRGPIGSTGGSVLATIEGMLDSDKALEGLAYTLICDRGAETGIKIVGAMHPSDDKKLVFDGSKIKDDDICALEITANVPADRKITWHNTQGRKGLFYGSSASKVVARQLSLTLYMIYSEKVNPTVAFATNFNVQFDVAEDKVPADPVAQLECEGVDKPATTNIFTSGATKQQGTFEFTLSTVEMKGKSCKKLTVLVENVAKFETSTDFVDVGFDAPAVGAKYAFPKDAGKFFTLKPKAVEVNVVTNPGGACINYNAEARKCEDIRSFEFAREKNYWVAYVQGKTRKGMGEVVEFYVTSGDGGVELSLDKTITIETMNKAILPAASEADKDKVKVYQDSVTNVIFGAHIPFDSNLVNGYSLMPYEATDYSLKDVQLLNIETIWIHGFEEVPKTTLDGMASAFWMAEITASPLKFVVTGGSNFYSNSPYFSWDALVSAVRSDTESTGLAYYAIKDGYPKSCDFTSAEFQTSLSSMTESGLSQVANVNQCGQALFESDFEAVSGEMSSLESAKYYTWDWHVVSK